MVNEWFLSPDVPHDKTVISFRLSNCPPDEDAWKVQEYMHVDETSGRWTHESSDPGSIQFGLTPHQVTDHNLLW